MKTFEVLMKDLKQFVRNEKHLFASGCGKRLFVRLQAGPNVERYVVTHDGKTAGFAKAGDAVRYFNAL